MWGAPVPHTRSCSDVYIRTAHAALQIWRGPRCALRRVAGVTRGAPGTTAPHRPTASSERSYTQEWWVVLRRTSGQAAKAAQAHLTRLLAADLGPDHIRVNTVNPDAVIAGSNIWSGGWAEGRAKAYGITVEELPAYYAKRTLLNEIILPEDIANACFAFVGGLLNKSTGNALNVDGGVTMGFLR